MTIAKANEAIKASKAIPTIPKSFYQGSVTVRHVDTERGLAVIRSASSEMILAFDKATEPVLVSLVGVPGALQMSLTKSE